MTKAFDTVDHNILLKLFFYGARDNNLKLLQSYLLNRKQYIAHQKISKIEYKIVICGVPQGSILGPLLFLIFTNDFWHSTPFLEAILFADDTNPFYSHNNDKELFRTINAELSHLKDRLCADKLSLNTNKTKYVLFQSLKQHNSQSIQPSICINSLNAPKLSSYRNQSIVLLCKSINWFLYDGNFGI